MQVPYHMDTKISKIETVQRAEKAFGRGNTRIGKAQRM